MPKFEQLRIGVFQELNGSFGPCRAVIKEGRVPANDGKVVGVVRNLRMEHLGALAFGEAGSVAANHLGDLPPVIAGNYDSLWTDERIQKLVKAAAANRVAIELNDRYKLPSAKIIRAAKAAGCKFSFGTNDSGPEDLRRSEYGISMVQECKLTSQDFFVPGAWWPKAIDRKPDALRA